MRAPLAVACVLACGKSDAPPPAPTPPPTAPHVVTTDLPVAPSAALACELTRDKYVAWSSDRMRSAIREAPADQQAELQAEADKELARAKDRFIPVCVEMGVDLDPSCFDKVKAREHRCEGMLHGLEARLLAPH